MFKHTAIIFAVPAILALAQPLTADDPEISDEALRAAVARSLPLLEKAAVGHRTERTCFACHNEGIPLLAMTTARSRGFAINDEEVQTLLKHTAEHLERNREGYLQGKGQGGAVDMAGYALWTLEIGGWKPDETTNAVAEYLLLYQADSDHWKTGANRPPSEISPFTTTYVGLRGIGSFGTKEQQERITARTSQARDWLVKAEAKDCEDRVFRLWGLQASAAPQETIDAARKQLIDTQRADGGWGQLAEMESDAYATGTALVALHEAGGLFTNDKVYQRGLAFLLKTQGEDGSWHVKSRSKPFQKYFETGFPHGKDQFISCSASAWATTAMALACENKEAAQ